MKLEEIVPPVDLCKKIPAGEFADSCFLFVPLSNGKEWKIMKRTTMLEASNRIAYPAPTVTEILKVLWNDYQKPTVYFRNIWCARVVNDYGDKITEVDNENAANAALKLWLKLWLELKGIE